MIGLGIRLGLVSMPAWMAGSSYPELWVQPPTTTVGGAGFCDITGSQIIINRDGSTSGSFTSDATLSRGVEYILGFTYARSGGTTTSDSYAIDCRYVSGAGDDVISQELSPTAGVKSYTFNAELASKIIFTLPGADWSANYNGISLKQTGGKPQLINNSRPLSVTTGWSSARSASLSIVGGKLRVTNAGGVATGGASQTITTEIGATYDVSVLFTKSGAVNGQVRVGTALEGLSLLLLSPSATGTVTGQFTASGTTTHFGLYNNGGVDGSLTDWSAISVKKQ
jgi:hypothetical protein